MSNKYPRKGSTQLRDKNTQALCRCGAIAKRKIHIEVNCFRGDDEVIWSCMNHRNDVDYLLGND